jgi:hypothetical protein
MEAGKMAYVYAKKGYRRFANSGKLVHKYVAERVMGGTVWKGYEVHHKDGNSLNNSRSNLVVLPKGTHRRIHAKKRSSW